MKKVVYSIKRTSDFEHLQKNVWRRGMENIGGFLKCKIYTMPATIRRYVQNEYYRMRNAKKRVASSA